MYVFTHPWTYLESSCEDRLEENTIMALESIPLAMMQKFSNRSLQFMDAYSRGLNGRQAVWASRKYCGHWVLPNNIMEELGRRGLFKSSQHTLLPRLHTFL